MTNKTLTERISDLLARSLIMPTDVYICWGPNWAEDRARQLAVYTKEGSVELQEIEPKLKRINEACNRNSTTNQEKYELTRDLLKLWQSKSDAECLDVFGITYQVYKNHPIHATLSGNRGQLRFWYGKCGNIGMNHVDSCGKGLLLHISGYDIQDYLKIAEELIGPRFQLPSGGVIFARTRENLPKYYGTSMGKSVEIDYSGFKEIRK
jgi:hypothetical protein